MVKESKRKKAYHPRASHKEGCMCAVCKAKRVKQEVPALIEPEISEVLVKPEILIPPPPTEVRLDSLLNATKFMLGGQEHLVKEKVEGMVVCYNLFVNDTMTFGGATMVKPIK